PRGEAVAIAAHVVAAVAVRGVVRVAGGVLVVVGRQPAPDAAIAILASSIGAVAIAMLVARLLRRVVKGWNSVVVSLRWSRRLLGLDVHSRADDERKQRCNDEVFHGCLP